MKKYEEPKLDIVPLNRLDIIKTSPNGLDEADVNAGSTKYTWN